MVVERLALGVHAARLRSTGRHANATCTDVRLRTIRIDGALRIIANDRHTATVLVGDGILGTATDDRAQRQRVEH